MTQVQALLFDKDGTLFDFDATWSEWAAEMIEEFADGDASTASNLAHALEYDLEHRKFFPHSTVIAGTAGEQAAKIEPFLPDMSGAEILEQMNAKAAAATQVEVTPLGPFIAELRARGLKVGVMTNDAEASARSHLSRAGVEGAFDFIAGYDSGFGEKPDPDPLLAFAKQVGVAPAAVAMVGDSPHDLLAAKAAGMIKIGVLSGPADREQLQAYADIVLETIADIPDWLDQTP